MNRDIRDVRQRVTAELRQDHAATEASMMARGTDPALNREPAGRSQSGPVGRGGLQWVPVMDVLRGRGFRLSEHAMSGQENLVRLMRHGMSRIASRHHSKTKTAALPQPSAFGQAAVPAAAEGVSR